MHYSFLQVFIKVQYNSHKIENLSWNFKSSFPIYLYNVLIVFQMVKFTMVKDKKHGRMDYWKYSSYIFASIILSKHSCFQANPWLAWKIGKSQIFF